MGEEIEIGDMVEHIPTWDKFMVLKVCDNHLHLCARPWVSLPVEECKLLHKAYKKLNNDNPSQLE